MSAMGFYEDLKACCREAIMEMFGAGDVPYEVAMVAQYGELVNIEKAAEILNKSSRTIRRYCDDGYIHDNGHGVAVRSIARFIQSKPEVGKRKRETKNINFVRINP